MTTNSKRNEIVQYSFLRVFANDRTIDAQELEFLEQLAVKDAVVDEGEKTALKNIFSRVARETVDAGVWAEMESFRRRHGF